jgi:hypothetical protein
MIKKTALLGLVLSSIFVGDAYGVIKRTKGSATSIDLSCTAQYATICAVYDVGGNITIKKKCVEEEAPNCIK